MSGDISVTVWFDYTCPHCHRGLVMLDTLSEELPLTIDRRPYLLRPNAPLNGLLAQTSAPDSRSKIAVASSLRPPLTTPGTPPAAEPFSSRSLSTVLVHEATAFAKDHGRDWEFYLELSGEYWQRGADLGSIYTLRRSAAKVGLDWEAMWLKLESGHYRPWVMEEHRAAAERGVTVAPSYLIGGKVYAANVRLEEIRRALQEANPNR